MAFNWAYIKEHKVLFGVGGVGLFILLYYFLSRGSSSSSTATGSSGVSQADVQLAQLSAQDQLAQMQLQAQSNAVSTQAGVQSQAISASQAVQLAQTTAAQNVAENTNATQVQLAQVQGQTQDQYIQSLSDIVTAQYTAQENQSNNVLKYLETVSNNQAAVASQGITTQAQLNETALSHLKEVGGSQNRTSIIESAMGNIPGSITAEQGATASAVSGNQTTASIASGITGAVAALFGA